MIRAVPIALSFLLCAAAPEEARDLRDIAIGMRVADLPQVGYTGLACAAQPERKLTGWMEYQQCPAATAGSRAISFHYDASTNPLARINDAYGGTKVAGHPVLLTLLVDPDARVEGLIIETDPAARLYMRKKAFLLGDMVKQRFGTAGWQCEHIPPAAGREPVGGVYLDEHCTKETEDRRLTLDSALYRTAAQDLKEFTSRTRLEIRSASH